METNEAVSATKPFQCKHCPKSFAHKKSIEYHILNIHGKEKLKIKPLHCSECLKTKQVTKYFPKQHLLNKHIRDVHTQRRSFECDICFKTFGFPYEMRKHQETHSTKIETKFKCDICSKFFTAHKTLKSHVFYKHDRKLEGVNYLACDLCPQEFLTKAHLERHVLAKHVVDKAFECGICSKMCIDQKTLEKHVKLHNRPVKYFCDVCFKGFKCNKDLPVHLGVKHNKFFYCNKCSRSFTNKPEFDEHVNTKTGPDFKLKLKCPSCSKILPSQCTLHIHTNSHPKQVIKTEKGADAPMKCRSEVKSSDTEEKEEAERPNLEIKCQLCSKIFDRESYFSVHRRQAHRNADWPCGFEQCTRSFKFYNKLRLHRMRHSAVKPFECPTCHKSFSVKPLLTEHLKTHLDEKQFKCEMCPKTFSRREVKRIHIANKHGGFKPFKCPVTNCGMSFAANATLNTHLVSHETLKLYKCDICTEPKEFKGLVHLKQHLRVVHSVCNIGQKQILSESKYADALVFTCTAKECSFETGSDKQVAIHYNEQHGLPNVQLFQNNNIKIKNNISGSMPLFSGDMPKFRTNKMILKRYKCKFCLKLLSFSWFKQHQETCTVASAFKCSQCSIMFRFKKSLSNHISRIHYNKKKY